MDTSFIQPPSGTIIYSDQLSADSNNTEMTFGIFRLRVGQVGSSVSFPGTAAIYAPNKIRACVDTQEPRAEQLNEIGRSAIQLCLIESEQTFVSQSLGVVGNFSQQLRELISANQLLTEFAQYNSDESIADKLLRDMGTYVRQLVDSRPRLSRESNQLIMELHQLQVVELDLNYGLGMQGRFWPIRQMALELQQQAA